MSKRESSSFAELMTDSAQVMAAVNKAIENALRVHKLLGYSVVAWRDSQVVWIPPDEIPVRIDDDSDPPQLPMF